MLPSYWITYSHGRKSPPWILDLLPAFCFVFCIQSVFPVMQNNFDFALQTFSHKVSNDKFLDPCKAGEFVARVSTQTGI